MQIRSTYAVSRKGTFYRLVIRGGMPAVTPEDSPVPMPLEEARHVARLFPPGEARVQRLLETSHAA